MKRYFVAGLTRKGVSVVQEEIISFLEFMIVANERKNQGFAPSKLIIKRRKKKHVKYT